MAAIGGEKLDQIRKELTCAICHGCLQTPTLLSCNHSYCRQCLMKLHNSSANKLQLECPICRQTTALPEGKVEALKTNFQLQSLIDIASEEETSQSARSLNAHPQPSRKEALCEKHGKPLEHFCTDCYELLCSKCITTHRGHRFYHIDEPDLQTEVEALHNEVQKVVAKAENMEKHLHTDRDDVLSNGDQTREAIQAYFRKAQETLQDREKNLLSAVQQYTDASLAALTKHSQQIETDKSILPDVGERRHDTGLLANWKGIKKQLEACEQSVSSTAKKRESGTMFLRFKGDNSILPALNELGVLNECQREQTRTMYVTTRRIEVGKDGSDMYVHSPHPLPAQVPVIYPPSDAYVLHSSLGPRESSPGYYILASSLPDMQPQQVAEAQCILSSSPYIRQPASFTSSQGVYVEVSMEGNNWNITRRKLSEPQRASEIPYDMTSSLYNQPAASGEEGIYDEVPMEGDECLSSQMKPSELTPRPCSTKCAGGNSEPEDDYEILSPPAQPQLPPCSVPFIIPAESGSHPGTVPPLPPRDYTTMDVKLLNVVGKNQLVSLNSAERVQPNGVCCDPVHDNIIITDLRNYCVRLLDKNGNFLEKIGKEGKGKGEFNVPVAVVFSGDHFYVADQGNSRIQKFTRAGDFCTMFGQSQIQKPVALAIDPSGSLYVSDQEKKQIHVFHEDKFVRSISYARFKGPAGIAFNRQGKLLVADMGEHCIWQMTTEGVVLKKIGSDYLNCPYGVAVARHGSIVVTESAKHISVFFPDGTRRCLGGIGSDPGMFRLPQHICINSKGHIIVADAGNERLQIFDFVSIIED